MTLLHSDTELFGNIKKFISSAENFVLFAPYIKENALSNLLYEAPISKYNTIVTTWKPKDIALGSSDINIYPLCQGKGITLLINNHIHLKSYIVDDFDRCIVTSSNISARGIV